MMGVMAGASAIGVQGALFPVWHRCAVVSMGAESVNQAVKSVAITRAYVESDMLDITFRPKFIHIGIGM